MKKITFNRDAVKKIWIICGAIFLLTMSPFFQLLFGPIWYFNKNLWPIFPLMLSSILHLFGRSDIVMILIILSIFFSSAFPLVFFIYGSLKMNVKRFILYFFILITVTMFYDAYFFYRHWDYGLHYQGLEFLSYSAIKSIIFFSSIYILVGVYCKTHNAIFLHMTLLLFCVTISIVSFPYVGEIGLHTNVIQT